MLRATLVLLALLGSVTGQNPKPSAAKGLHKGRGATKGPGKGRGAAATPAQVADQPELHKLREEMRKSWCAGGRHAETSPCMVEAFLTKYRAESDAAKKQKLMSAHIKEQAEKRKADPDGMKTKLTHDFFGMFSGFCAENPSNVAICTNKQLLHFKSINQLPPFGHHKPAGKASLLEAEKKKLQAGA